MGTPGGRKLRPLAVVCALLFVLWGAASAASLVAQLMLLDELGWPDGDADGEIWAWTLLYLSGAASGCWVAVWGLFGLAWRPPLHLGALSLLVAVGLEVSANLVQASYIADQTGLSWGFGDQFEAYVDRLTGESNILFADQKTEGLLIALPLLTVGLPLLVYLFTLVSGAGRKRRLAPAYPQPFYQQPQAFYPPAPPAFYYPPQPVHQPQPAHQPQPVYEPPPAREERVPWKNVPPVLPAGRPATPLPKPPDQQETQPYRKPTEGA